MANTTFRPGEKVRVKAQFAKWQHRDKIYTVSRLLPKNIEVVDENGQKMRGNPTAFEQFSEGMPPTTIYVEPLPEHFTLGEVVTVKHAPNSAKWRYTRDQKFVVIRSSDKINIVKLGGDGDRYWRMQPSSLVRVEV